MYYMNGEPESKHLEEIDKYSIDRRKAKNHHALGKACEFTTFSLIKHNSIISPFCFSYFGLGDSLSVSSGIQDEPWSMSNKGVVQKFNAVECDLNNSLEASRKSSSKRFRV